MTNWKTTSLGDIVTLNYGKSLTANKRVAGSIPVYSSAGITGWHNQALVNSPSIIVGRKGTVGSVYFNDKPFYCIDTAYYILPDESYDLKFMYYMLQTLGLEHLNEDSAVPGLNRERAYAQIIFLPDLPTQRRIAEILSALDDKIELNRQMNQTLEQMAQTLFRQYFVDGIDEKNLPEGWKLGKLSDVSKNVRKTVNPKVLQQECKYVGLEHIPRKSIALTDWSTSAGVESQKSKFEENHILFGKLRPYFHKVILAPFEGICSTDILVIEPLKDYMLAFCLLHYSSEEVIQYSNQLSHGTRMPRADWKGLSGYEIAIPPIELFIKFNDLVLPSLQKIKANIEQIQTLTKLRDNLLPKLMSGEIDVMQLKIDEQHEPILS